MMHLLRIGTATLIMLCGGILSAQHTGWAGENPSSRAGSCTFFTITGDPTAATCNGANNGIASVIVSGGVGPFTFIWVGGPTTQSWNGVGAGTYTVIVFDQGQGSAACNIDVIVNEPGPLSVFAMNAVSPTCFGACNGTAAPIVIGGAGGYSFSWSNGQSGTSANNLCNPFSLTITDATGCFTDTTYIFQNEPQEIIITGIVTPISCFGETDGAVEVNITGGSSGYNISWSGPGGFTSSDQNISNLSEGSYTITVTDQNDCLADTTFIITEPEEIAVVADITENACATDTLASINITITGGTIPYSIIWDGPNGFSSNSETLSNLATGTYNLQLTDSNNCVFNASYEVSAPPLIEITLTATDVTCAGESDGTIICFPEGGSGIYTIFWTGPNGFTSGNQNLTDLEAGIYEVTVTDDTGCENTASIEILDAEIIVATTALTHVTCAGEDDGTITLSISGGNPAYDVEWAGPNGFTSSDESLTGLQAGIYSYTITDQNNCELTDDVTIQEPDAIDISGETGDVFCAGLNNGFINLTITGGQPDYTFDWDGPNGFTSTNQNILNLEPGDYEITVTDSANCNQSTSFTILENDPIVLDAFLEQPDCADENTGSISLTITGGNPNLDGGGNPIYIINWTGPDGFTSNAVSINLLAPGSYSVLVEDGNGCEITETYEIIAPDELELNASVQGVSCIGGDGTINLTISGGTPDYTFQWSGPDGFNSTQQNLSGLNPGSYTIIVADINDCSITEIFEINDTEPIIINETVTDVQCQGVSNGSVELEITGGIFPYTFQWSGPNGFTSTDEDIFSLDAGTYTVIVTDSAGCTEQASFTLIELSGLIADATIIDADCENNDDGEITVILSGGTEPYSTFWLGPNGFTANGLTITGLEAGEYIFVATDAADCFIEQPFIVNNPSSLTADAVITDLLCFGETTGAIEITINGLIPIQSINWDGPNGFSSTNQNISGLSAGTYTLTITDANDCVLIESFDLTEPDELLLSLVETHPSCGLDNGAIVSTVSGGTTDYSYEWTDELNNIIGTDANISDLGVGTYTLLVSDANGCQASASVTLTETVLNVLASITPVSCLGFDDGQIELTITGGVQPYTVVWNGPDGFTSNNPTIINLAAGDYTVQVLDDIDCPFTETYTVAAATQIDIEAALTPAGCLGQNAGSINLTITGGTPDYSFAWTGPNGFTSINQNLNNLEAGIYSVDVTDAIGCFATASFELIESIPIIVDAEINDVQCQGVEDGFINLTITGGSPGFTFNWSGPNGFTSTDQDIMGLIAGEYTVTITDNLGCTHQETYTIIEIEGLEIEATITDANCADNDDGAITVILTGGNPPYSTFWLGPNDFTANGLSISGLEAGVYTFVATDSEDCFIEIPLVVNNPSSVSAVADITNILCAGESNGAITLTLEGVSGPIDISWSGPNGFSSTDQNINGLIAGTYQLTIIDEEGCEFNAFYEVTEPEALVVLVDVTQPTCALSNGQLLANISGGTPDYQVLWTDEQNNILGTDPTLSNLSAGIYTLTVADDNGCTYSETFELTDSDVTVNATVTDILCNADNNGAITLDISGGIQPYTVVWSGPNGFTSNSPTISDLLPGTYEVTVLDDSNCSVSLSFEITEPALLELTATAGPSSCQQNNGFVSATITGGTIASDYNISWLDENNIEIGTDDTINDLPAGIYTVVVSDDNGCEVTDQVAISDQDATITATIQNPTCGGANDGSITIEITGGTEPYTILWNGPNGFSSSDQNISSLETGVYTLNITDSLGCVFTDLYDLTEPAPFSLDLTATPISCFGDENGTINLTIGGGISPYQIVWTGPDGFSSTDQNLVDLAAGTYSVVVIDSLSCVSTADIEILSPEPIAANFDVVNNLCSTDTAGSITVTLIGGTNPFTFQWISSNGFTSDQQNINNLAPGFYELLVTDSLGCSAQFDTTISSSPELTVDFTVMQPNCFGAQNGTIASLVSGGTPNYTYTWSGPNGFSSDSDFIENLEAGTYFLTLLDSNLCAYQDSIVLTQPDSLFAEITATNILCFGDNNGTIEALITGGTTPYTSNWSGPDGFSSSDLILIDLIPGDYTLSVLDSNGCAYNTTVLIATPEELNVTLAQVTDALCNTDNSGSISTEVIGGTEPYTFSWSGPNNYLSDEQNPDSLFPGTYNLFLADTNGCVDSLEVVIEFTFEISADAGVDFGLCNEDQPIMLNGTSENATDVQWLNSQGFVISDQPSIETLSVPGTFTYYFVASNGLCSAIDSITVTVYPQPNVSAGVDETIFEGDEAIIGGFPTSSSGTIYVWTPGGSLSDSTVANPIATPVITTQYTVMVTDTNGCVGIDSLLITVIPEIRFPSGITPNGDGINDSWIIDYIDLYPNNVVEVYSRWGDLLYRAEGYDNNDPWDGFYNGKELPVGTYYYIVELRDERYPEPFTGPITIFR
jgi:gliding motility-associated-like protein